MRYSIAGVLACGVAATFVLGGCAVAPMQLTPEQLSENAADKMARVTEGQLPLTGRLTLQDAMARALAYNLDHRVEAFDHAVKLAELDVAHYNLLPNAVANAGYANRDNDQASSSFNLVTNRPNFGVSTSTDRALKTADMAFSWHILDFGLSFVRARQAADRALIAEEGRRKVVHRLMEDVRSAYWRAWTAQQLSNRLVRLERLTRAAMAESRAQSADRDNSPILAVTYRRELIEIERTIRELKRDLSVAKYQLASLINVMPGSVLTLAAPAQLAMRMPPGGVREMVSVALQSRSELRDIAYRQRINQHEADAALLELLPGIQLYAGPHLDSNSFLLNEQWVAWGAKASWNVIRLFQYPARRGVIDAQDELLDKRALAMAMAVMTQVHVSRVRLANYQQELATARDFLTTQRELIGYVEAEFAAGKVSQQTRLRERLNTLVSEVRYNVAMSAVEAAKASLIASIGLEPELPELRGSIVAQQRDWSAAVHRTAAR